MFLIVTTEGHEIEWHVGDKKPEMWSREYTNRDQADGALRDECLQRISSIQADSQELERIQKLFGMGLLETTDFGPKPTAYSIPMPNKQVCRWYGDLARTIYLNL